MVAIVVAVVVVVCRGSRTSRTSNSVSGSGRDRSISRCGSGRNNSR